MAVRIRLARCGAKKRPFYRIVVADGQAPRDGRFLENVGTYNPMGEATEVTLKKERLQYWLGQGALPSNTVNSIFKKEGL